MLINICMHIFFFLVGSESVKTVVTFESTRYRKRFIGVTQITRSALKKPELKCPNLCYLITSYTAATTGITKDVFPVTDLIPDIVT